MFKSSDHIIDNMDKTNRYQMDLVRKDFQKYVEDYKKMSKDIYNSTAIYKGEPVPFFSIPKLFTPKDIDHFQKAVQDIFHIVNKTIALYLKEDSVRALYGFDKRLDELIRIPACYDTNVPMGRFDIFYNDDGSYQFCELNTDGTSAQSEEDGLSKMIIKGENVKKLEKQGYNISSFELFESWVSSIEAIYQNYLEVEAINHKESYIKTNKRIDEKPYVAIVDFISGKPTIEFEMFKRTFLENGFRCEIVDPRDIQCKNGQMINTNDHQRIDIVYRRLVTRDMMERYEDIQGFIEGLKANKTCVVGNIKTQIVHSKKFFEVLHNKQFQKYLTKEEIAYINEHIPYTIAIRDIEDYDKIINNKDDYLIKPVDYYASKGVYSGQDMSKEEWQQLIDKKKDSSDLLQCYCKVAVSENVLFIDKNQMDHFEGNAINKENLLSVMGSSLVGVPVKIRNITGLYVYNEKFAGIYSRGGLNSIISGLHDGYTLSSLVIEKN